MRLDPQKHNQEERREHMQQRMPGGGLFRHPDGSLQTEQLLARLRQNPAITPQTAAQQQDSDGHTTETTNPSANRR
jgi:hypothetical protein